MSSEATVSMASLRVALVGLMESAGTTITSEEADRLIRALTIQEELDRDDMDEGRGSLSPTSGETSPTALSPDRKDHSHETLGSGKVNFTAEECFFGYGTASGSAAISLTMESQMQLGDDWLSRHGELKETFNDHPELLGFVGQLIERQQNLEVALERTEAELRRREQSHLEEVQYLEDLSVSQIEEANRVAAEKVARANRFSVEEQKRLDEYQLMVAELLEKERQLKTLQEVQSKLKEELQAMDHQSENRYEQYAQEQQQLSQEVEVMRRTLSELRQRSVRKKLKHSMSTSVLAEELARMMASARTEEVKKLSSECSSLAPKTADQKDLSVPVCTVESTCTDDGAAETLAGSESVFSGKGERRVIEDIRPPSTDHSTTSSTPRHKSMVTVVGEVDLSDDDVIYRLSGAEAMAVQLIDDVVSTASKDSPLEGVRTLGESTTELLTIDERSVDDASKHSLTRSLSQGSQSKLQWPSSSDISLSSQTSATTAKYAADGAASERMTGNGYALSLPSQASSTRGKSNQPARIFNVAVLGDSGVGKTTFIQQFARHFEAKVIPTPTVGIDFLVRTTVVDNQEVSLKLWDTAGTERFHSLTLTYLRRCDGVILMYDVTSEKTFRSLSRWLVEIEKMCRDGAVLLVLGNKVDLVDSGMKKRVVSRKAGANLARGFGDGMFSESSGHYGLGVDEACTIMTRAMLAREDENMTLCSSQIVLDYGDVSRKKTCCSRKA